MAAGLVRIRYLNLHPSRPSTQDMLLSGETKFTQSRSESNSSASGV
jgi:hypothetical protein